MKPSLNPLGPLVAKQITNPLVSSTAYRVLVVVADLADSENKITSHAVADKLGLGKAAAYVNLKKLIKLGFLQKVRKSRDNYTFRPQELWLKTAEQSNDKTATNVDSDSSLHAEIKALQDLTKELISKLNK